MNKVERKPLPWILGGVGLIGIVVYFVARKGKNK
ncbi:MAG: hypothetical protein MRECE_9c017 [Mycoplasmataceae bacterium CE_OT135]|nr:MAG: hypothetical protein MRECE_9c017 [Mycoplasmataceae bacterium CE_OT135]